MKVKTLIKKLQELDQDKSIFINGYEGGVDRVRGIEKDIKVLLNQHDEWYYGKHEQLDKYDIEAGEKYDVEGYKIY